MRKVPLANDKIYHIYNRSIAKYQIFNDPADYLRMLEVLELFKFTDFKQSYSSFTKLTNELQYDIKGKLIKSSDKLVEIIAYCLMPTHFHLILKQVADNGITTFMARVQNSYSRYFNQRHRRKGPLWEGHFNNTSIDTDELILHITRYLHINAVTAKIVDRPEDWPYSSYFEYIDSRNAKIKMCHFKDILDIEPKKYKRFVNNQIGYQRELSKIKHLLIEDYSG